MPNDNASPTSIAACAHARHLRRLVDEIVFLVDVLSAPALKVGDAEQIAALQAEANRMEGIDAALARVLRDRASRIVRRSSCPATKRAASIGPS